MTAEMGQANKPGRGRRPMIHKFLPRAAFALTACLSPALLGAAAADAADFSAEYVFGDSLSDNGNLALLTGGFPPRRVSTTASPMGLSRFNSWRRAWG